MRSSILSLFLVATMMVASSSNAYVVKRAESYGAVNASNLDNAAGGYTSVTQGDSKINFRVFADGLEDYGYSTFGQQPSGIIGIHEGIKPAAEESMEQDNATNEKRDYNKISASGSLISNAVK